ncbi:hypothetical protein Tco_1276247 [Tanacetum coccineum]
MKGGGLAGGDGDNTGTGDDTGSGGDTGSDGDGIEGSGVEGTGAGIKILAVTRYSGCGGGIPDDGASDMVGESMKGGGNGLGGGVEDNTGEGGDSGSDGDVKQGYGGECILGKVVKTMVRVVIDGGVNIGEKSATSASDHYWCRN